MAAGSATAVAERAGEGAGAPMAFSGGLPEKSAGPRPVGVRIRVDPPGERIVGAWGRLVIQVFPEADIAYASVKVAGEGSLEVSKGGVAYEGPLVGRRMRQMSVQVRAHDAGEQRLRVVVSSQTPGLSTTVPVTIPGYHISASAALGQTTRTFRSVPLGQAAQLVAEDCGLSVAVAPELASKRVTADFSPGFSGGRALRLLAELAGGRVEQTGSDYRLTP